MANRNPSRTTSSRAFPQTTPRHLWLAALGAAAIARRTTLSALDAAVGETGRFGREAGRLAGDARLVARGAGITVQEAVAARIGTRISQLRARVEARLAPVLDGPRPKPAQRKPVRKARKATKQPARRGAGGRKKAATRVARKGRG